MPNVCRGDIFKGDLSLGKIWVKVIGVDKTQKYKAITDGRSWKEESTYRNVSMKN